MAHSNALQIVLGEGGVFRVGEALRLSAMANHAIIEGVLLVDLL